MAWGIVKFVLSMLWVVASKPGLAITLPCEPGAALAAEIAGIDEDGIITIGEGYRLRLANIVWPDHLEPNRRARLRETLAGALKGQRISWKPASGPDRWGITPAHLFVQEPGEALPPFWLQAGLVEAGIVPGWPEGSGAACWAEIRKHESEAIRHRRDYWAPRAQTARHRVLEADREAHAGRKIVALWRVRSVRPWRNMHFVNIVPSLRGGPAIGVTKKQMDALIAAEKNPAAWRGKMITARFIVGVAGLSRLRVESIDHIGPVE